MPHDGGLAAVRRGMGAAAPGWVQKRAGSARDRLDAIVGGRVRRHVVVVLGCVLALAAADQGALSATADQIRAEFHISTIDLGLLGTVSAGISAVTTVPFGMYVDRVVRTRLLGWTVLVWAAAMIASAAATSYLFLLLARVGLGVVVAVAYPAVASLIGDYFPSGERGRIYGYVLTGELVGSGLGIALAGGASSLFGSWRAAMLALAVPALGVTWQVLRLPEPARGGPSRMPAGQHEILSADRVGRGAGPDRPVNPAEVPASGEEDLVKQLARDRHIRPHDGLVLRTDPRRMRLPAAIGYVLRVRTNVIVIVAGALGFFFFAGLRFFAIEYVTMHYGVSRGVVFLLLLVVGIGAVAGALVGGRVADRLLRAGRINARIVVPAAVMVAAAVLFAGGVWTTSITPAVGLFFLATFFFTASNPPLEASRLDVMPGRLWGRAEAVRAVFRGGLQAAAPVTFGIVADTAFGGQGDAGLRDTFMVMLLPLLVAGLVLLLAMRTYPRDVATADATEEALRKADAETGPAEAERPRPNDLELSPVAATGRP